MIDGKTDLTKCTEIDLQKLNEELRTQTVIFTASVQVYEQMRATWQGESTKFALLGQVIALVQKYIEGGKIEIVPPLFNVNPTRKKLMYILNMNRIVQHIWGAIQLENTEKLFPVFDNNRRARSTADMPTWWTTKPCAITQKSQISHGVFDSAWESTESYVLEKNPHVLAWAKNDHLGFEIVYSFNGVIHRYTPDFFAIVIFES